MRFRFTIRDLLWLTLVVALVVVLWIESADIKRERATLKQQQAELTEHKADLTEKTDDLNALREAMIERLSPRVQRNQATQP
jgi:uncharacterized protein YpmS